MFGRIKNVLQRLTSCVGLYTFWNILSSRIFFSGGNSFEQNSLFGGQFF